jgi:hypothetical protein
MNVIGWSVAMQMGGHVFAITHQDRGMIRRPASVGWNNALKPILTRLINEDIYYAFQADIADVVEETLRK